jgi:hypothetical protein
MMPPQGMPPQQLAAGGPVGYADGGAPITQAMRKIASQGPQEGVGYGSNNGSLITQAMRKIASQGPQEGVGYGSNNGSLITQAMRKIASQGPQADVHRLSSWEKLKRLRKPEPHRRQNISKLP